MRVEFSHTFRADSWPTVESRRIGRTHANIVQIELVSILDDKVFLIKKDDGSLYATIDPINGKIVKLA